MQVVTADDAAVRLAAVEFLAKRGAEASPSIPEIKKLLNDKDNNVRTTAGWALGQIGPTEEMFKSDNEWVRIGAAIALGRKGSASIPALEALVNDKELRVRLAAISAIGNMGAKGKAAVPALIKLINGEPYVSGTAVIALGRLGKEAKAAIPALEKLRDGKRPYIGRFAIMAIVKIDPEAKGAIPALIASLKVAGASRDNVADIAKLGPRAMPILADLLTDNNRDIREAAAKSLVKMGSRAIPTLAEKGKNPKFDVCISALGALASMGPDAIPALTGLLKDGAKDVRVYAPYWLTRMRV